MILTLTASIMYWSLNQKGGGNTLTSARNSDASLAESGDEAEDAAAETASVASEGVPAELEEIA